MITLHDERPRRRLTAVGLGVLLTCLALVAALAPAASATPQPSRSRLIEITLPARGGELPAQWYTYSGPPRAKVLLPPGYDQHKSYPLLVLLAGFTNDYRSWSNPDEGRIATTAAGFDGIIVMPEGAGGWYTDWFDNGRMGPPRWESYLLDQVIPQVTQRFPIRPERRWHAMAGVSMGGLGAAYLAGRLPGYFGSVAILSGLVDTHLVFGQGAAQSVLAQSAAGQPLDPGALYGPETGPYSIGHNPVELVDNLAHTRVFMAAGDGIPTEDGQPYRSSPDDALREAALIRPASDNYARVFAAAGIPVTYQPGHGAHNWPKFRTELQAAMRWGMFTPVENAPRAWTNKTVATHGRLWDLEYRFARPPSQVVQFSRSGDRLTISAAGSPVTVTTSRGCVIRAATPTVVDVSGGRC